MVDTAPPSVAGDSLAPFLFPSTWKASFSHWWSSSATDVYHAQRALLERGLKGSGIAIKDYDTVEEGRISPVNDEGSPSSASTPTGKVAHLRKIDLGGGQHRILNVLEVGPAERRKDEQTFVVVHGYGSAWGFYWQNLKALCSDKYPNTRFYFMDMLGMGLSGRPKFPSIKVKGDPLSPANIQSRVEQAESFFLDSFEDFAKKEQLSSFTMMGHSLGGYLSTAYALKYPERVKKLVLISPVGVPRSPYMDDEEEEAKVGEARVELDHEAGTAGGKSKSASSSGTSTPTKTRPKPPSSWWAKAWDANVSPFAVVRLSTFAGPKLVSTYAQRRFATFPQEVQAELFPYLYGIYSEKGSGEYCLAHILSPGAYARWPLISRLGKLNPKVPVTFVYGQNDWMDVKGGRAAAELLRSRPNVAPQVSDKTQVYINPHAGHWVMLDNPDGMNTIFESIMKDTLRDHPVA